MLRLYKPIVHDISKLQIMLSHLVCSIWSDASDVPCDARLSDDFKIPYIAYPWLKERVDEIYEECKSLNDTERRAIKDAFEINNKIEELCKGTLLPVYLNQLPEIVEKKIKPLLVDFYETLLERKLTPGTKKDYYEKLITENDFKYCPCCGMTDIEQEDSMNREAFDHYLPKSHYPFSSVNFENLVPLCYKCNSDRKGEKDPIEAGRKAFYPFSTDEHSIEITVILDKSKDLGNLERADISITFTGDSEKIGTWNSLFEISDRYNDMIRSFSKTHLRKIKRRHARYAYDKPEWTYIDSLNELINDYTIDKYDDKKFLKIPLMMELKNCPDLIEVYGNL